MPSGLRFSCLVHARRPALPALLLAAVAAFPNAALLLHEYGSAALALVLMALTSVLIILKHYENILRLLAGTEHRIGSRTA